MNQELNNIIASQNREDRLDLLRAQRVYYLRAKRLQSVFIFLALALPWVGVVWGAEIPKLRPWLASAGIVLLLVDIAFATRVQRNWVKTAARIQEQFDTEVYELPWNQLVVGPRVDPEAVRLVTRRPIGAKERSGLEGWYEKCIGTLPLGLARLVCQRTNVTYDMRVRKAYANGLLVAAALLGFYFLHCAMQADLPFAEIVLTAVVPYMPFAAFVLREHRKQADTVETLTTLKSEIDKLWSRSIKSPNSAELMLDARSLQDAIYRNRTSNPLVYDWVYWLMRKLNEDLARHAAQSLVDEAQRSLNQAQGAK